MPSFLLAFVLVLALLSPRPFQVLAQNKDQNEAHVRAKRAAQAFSQKPWPSMDNHGLILVPVRNKQRWKRALDDLEEVADEVSSNHTKYKRLSHSVHIQSDIRYR